MSLTSSFSADELFQLLDKNSKILNKVEVKGKSYNDYIDQRMKEIERHQT